MPAPLIGAAAETHYFPTFAALVPTLEKIQNPYHPFDFKTADDTTFIELKARTFQHDKYPTTMVGQNKVDCAKLNPDKTYYFAFSFTDGLYWIKYDPETFRTFRVAQGGRYDRGHTEVSIYCYIPITHLSRVAQSTPSAQGLEESAESPHTTLPQTDRRP